MAERKTPVLLREGPLSGRVVAITRYTRQQTANGELIKAQTKHDVDGDFRHLLLHRVLGDPADALQPILVKAARGEDLTDAERDLIGQMADRLGEDIEAAP